MGSLKLGVYLKRNCYNIGHTDTHTHAHAHAHTHTQGLIQNNTYPAHRPLDFPTRVYKLKVQKKNKNKNRTALSHISK